MLARHPFQRGFKSERDPMRQWWDVPAEGTRAFYVWWLDRLVSEIVRRRDGYQCVICRSRNQPQAAHIFSRKNYSTRWDLENVWCNCDRHNRLHITNQDPFCFWAIRRLGPERFAALRDRALSGVKVETWQMAELLERLKKEYRREAQAVEKRAA